MFDLLESLQESLGYRIGLDNVAQATLKTGKIAHGLDAIEFYRSGRMQELKDYCQEDVRLTRDLYEFGIANGYIRIASKDGRQTKKLLVDWASKAIVQPAAAIIQPSEAQYRLF
jgi:DEAD/DEAH box helicase domain-containing protein